MIEGKNIKEKIDVFSKEKLVILLFFTIIIMSQGIRGRLNNIVGSSIFNYHIVPLIIIFFMFSQKNNKFNKINFIITLFISSLIIIGFLSNRYSISNFIRTIVGFIFPMLILLIDYRDINIDYLFPNILRKFNIYIYITFAIQVIMSIKGERTGGIVGHPLTAGWYYAIFISFNMLYYKYFKEKRDFFIIMDIMIALIGTVVAAGRISMIIVIFFSIIYSISCCKKKSIPYIILPTIMIAFLLTPMVDKYIWEKFRETASWGDVTNGRLLGIREMMFFKLYPNFLIGKGIGYSNYVSKYIFGVVNFENPIIMFSYDYGITVTILLLVLLIIKPIIIFINRRKYLIGINYLGLLIIPFTYNGLSETVGIFIVLIFIIYIFMCLEYNLDK